MLHRAVDHLRNVRRVRIGLERRHARPGSLMRADELVDLLRVHGADQARAGQLFRQDTVQFTADVDVSAVVR